MDQQIDTDLRALHSRLTDDEAIGELHSADIAALCASMQSLAKRLSVLEETLALHCGCEVSELREVAREIDGDHVVLIGDMVVPGD
jgi:hypothetical protein